MLQLSDHQAVWTKSERPEKESTTEKPLLLGLSEIIMELNGLLQESSTDSSVKASEAQRIPHGRATSRIRAHPRLRNANRQPCAASSLVGSSCGMVNGATSTVCSIISVAPTGLVVPCAPRDVVQTSNNLLRIDTFF
ncbi:unnamed protein product [Linum trigynum]|uniref:Uncharacterized protein n=1 Tax=Linum trigynum TaxID=586398 RepID=A0AAV2EP85_9ROSI